MDNAAKKILIVEDNELNMKLFHDLLEVQGYQIVGTGDGNAAFGIAKAEQPDLILMDIQLPEKSGLDVTREIKADETTREIPVIAVTAFAMREDEERIRAAGCDDYLAKPISVTEFLEKVKRVLA
ncbi:response regulator [Parvularcula sp. ZS-1/3]|uniref:Response regulator n=1 Tax=Parvularcula mediterranea TaxID=2732508 RepID=A0A7Y3W5E0_9PROT|nr:response regulator [Parvularcula mediterranea]NNU16685.1 response regulator [Parvularcula mediterranea]